MPVLNKIKAAASATKKKVRVRYTAYITNNTAAHPYKWVVEKHIYDQQDKTDYTTKKIYSDITHTKANCRKDMAKWARSKGIKIAKIEDTTK